MAAGSEATTYNLADLVELAWKGYIRVPHFQRDYRWGRDDIAKLLDSIIKGYPVGSLLLWARPARAAQITLGALSIDAGETGEALWVADGQQRITSLANSLHGDQRDPRFVLFYDLRRSEIVTRSNEPAVIPFPVLFDLQRLLAWFHDHPEIDARIDDASRVTKALREYKMPTYRVAQTTDIATLEEIFDRLNNSGKRLRRNEVFAALTAGTDVDLDNRLTISRISEKLDLETGFGSIDGNTVLQALLARRGPDITREIRIEFSDSVRSGVVEFPGESEQQAYAGAMGALRLAVRFLQNEAAVPHISMLPYRYLLVVLARFFAHHPEPDSRVRILLRRWFWRAALTGPGIFAAGTTGATRTMNRTIMPGDIHGSIKALIETIRKDPLALPDVANFRTNRASTKIVLVSWWDLHPRSPKSGKPYEQEALALTLSGRSTAMQAVYPVIDPRRVSDELHGWAASWLLLPDEDVSANEIDGMLVAHTNLDDEVWEAILASHGLTPGIVEMLVRGDADTFVRARQNVIRDNLAAFGERMCESKFEDTPSLDSLVLEGLEPDDDA
jgi:hypothetical protein